MKKASLKESKIWNVHFTNTDLYYANFTDTDLLGSRFHRCNLTRADFRDAKNYMVDLSSNIVKKAKFSLPEAVELLKSFDIEIY